MTQAMKRCPSCRRMHEPHCGAPRIEFAKAVIAAVTHEPHVAQPKPPQKKVAPVRDTDHNAVRDKPKGRTDAERQASYRTRNLDAVRAAERTRKRAKRATKGKT